MGLVDNEPYMEKQSEFRIFWGNWGSFVMSNKFSILEKIKVYSTSLIAYQDNPKGKSEVSGCGR